MIGTLVNVGAILLGTALGLLLKQGIPEKMQKLITQGIGLCVIIIGVSGAIETEMPLLLIFSLAIGAIIGNLIGIESKLEALGRHAQAKFDQSDGSTFAEGFITASLLFCVGAMAVVGSIESGLSQNHQLLFLKAVLDGFAALVLTTRFGIGVGLAALPVLLYQGTIALCAAWVSPFLTDSVMNELSAVGGVLILGIGLSVLDIKKIHVGDLLPAILIPPLYFLIIGLF